MQLLSLRSILQRSSHEAIYTAYSLVNMGIASIVKARSKPRNDS